MTERKALIVGVNAATPMGLLAFLRLQGYQVTAVSGDEALEQVEKSSFHFTLVDLNGDRLAPEALIHDLKLYPRNAGPIIAITDRQSNGHHQELLDVDAVLNRPFSLDELQQAIEKLVHPQ